MTIYYSEEHEWVSVKDNVGTVGITDYAQNALGDIVFVEVPEIGNDYDKGDEIAVVESVKAASEIYAPVSGEIIAINKSLEDNPEMVNEHAQNDAWFYKVKIKDINELDDLMDAKAYRAFLADLN